MLPGSGMSDLLPTKEAAKSNEFSQTKNNPTIRSSCPIMIVLSTPKHINRKATPSIPLEYNHET
jgi:hypothetical protein